MSPVEMHPSNNSSQASADEGYVGHNWFLKLNRYQWFVLFVAALGWLFDTMDQQLFALARTPAMRELLAERRIEDGKEIIVQASKDDVNFYGGVCTCVFMIGWAVGGLFCGVLGDRYGRARVMLWTILGYSLFTGLSSFSQNIWDFAFYRFLTRSTGFSRCGQAKRSR